MGLNSAGPNIQELVRQILAYETAGEEPATSAFRVSDKLRRHFSRLMGNVGYHSLMARALAMARNEAPGLVRFELSIDGSIEGLSGQPGTEAVQSYALVLERLLELLVMFISEPLTIQLIRDLWPDLPYIIEKTQTQR